jgi:carbamate kinase
MTADAQRANVRLAAEAIALVYQEHRIDLVITHGNGPQVGLLSLQGEAYDPDEAFPLDVLGAETEGMIGYMIEHELGNVLPVDVPVATLLTRIEVDGDDPAFRNPAKFVGPVYEKRVADALAASKGWVFRRDGEHWRRVVPSPLPKRIVEIRPIEWLLGHGTTVICAGGGGIPIRSRDDGGRPFEGVEAVVDKDRCSALLAGQLAADRLLLVTDVDAVYLDWGQPSQRRVRAAHPAALAEIPFDAGSMGPKVEAACAFALETGGTAAIGALAHLQQVVRGEGGTQISRNVDGIVLD